MEAATITVQYLNEPKPGKKMWSIKSSDGDYYSVFPTDRAKFQVGGTYDIQFETNENGYKTIKTPKGSTAVTKVAPSKPQIASQSHRNGHTQTEEMAAMGAVNRWVGQCVEFPDEATLENAYITVMRAWRNAVKRIAKLENSSTPFNDKVPF